MQRHLKSMLTSLLLPILWLPFVQAFTTSEKEIQHLLEFINQSDCVFIRNNNEYPAKKAREHLESKYDYAKRWVDSTEQFIERIASKSSISGKRYQVRCQIQLFYSGEWLNQELRRYRASQISQQPVAQ